METQDTSRITSGASILDYAKYYISKGWSVIPIKPCSKVPILSSWKKFQERYPTKDELIEWFGNGSENNIAIVTGKLSNLVVIDLDSEATLQFAKDNNFQDTPTVKTGRGYHMYYQYKEGVRNFQKRAEFPDIDLRAEGGIIVAPPSKHETGHIYYWMKGKTPDDLPFASLPQIILENKTNKQTSIKDLYKGVPEGQRNSALVRLTISWCNEGLSFDDCLENAHMINQNNQPPLPLNEVEATVKSIFNKHQNGSSQYFNKNTFIPSNLVNEIMDKHKFCYAGGVLYAYKDGYYQTSGENLINKLCFELLGKKVRNNYLVEAVNLIEKKNLVEVDDFNQHKNLINLKNGMYDIEKKILLPHDEKYLSTVRIPVTYDPVATCLQIEKFFSSSLPVDCINIAYELFGYSMIPDTSCEKAFMLTGSGANGKSVLLNLFKTFLSKDNVSNIPLQELSENKFKRAELVGKLANVFADLDGRTLESTNYLKTIVSGDPIDAEKKNKDPFSFHPYARLIFSANDIPLSREQNLAYYRRWSIIPFSNTFTGDKADRNLISKLINPTELSGLLNKALEGLSRLYGNNKIFSESEAVKKAMESYQKSNDPVSAFISDRCELDIESRIERTTLS
ncbi:MAG: bifunctional DNA primase/polymerase, partial [Nitrospirae bacterium]|nr:bifunctional DNA primase/polymerase [Nitrospirota bacterium]